MVVLIKYNAKLIFSYNALAACLLAALSPFFFRFSNMQFETLAKMGELYLSLTGPLLFIYLGRFEEHMNSWELVYTKRISYLVLHLGRMVGLLCFNACIIFVPLSVVYVNSRALKFGEGFWGIVFSAWFLGLLGLTAVELFENQKVGYILTLGYYLFETSTKGKYHEAVQIFGYVQGNYQSKRNVLLLCIFLIIFQMLVIKRRVLYKLWKH